MASEKNGKNVEVYTVPVSEALPQKKEDVKKFWHIDKEMLRFKMHYFLFVGAFSASLPYVPILAQKRIGISASALSAVFTTQRCVFIFTKPSMGYVSDYFNKLKVIICTLSVIATVFFFTILAIPKIEKETEKTNLPHVFSNNTRYDLLNTSEAYAECEYKQYYNNFQEVELLDFNDSDTRIMCIQSIQHLTEFLRQCSEDEKNNTDLYTILKQTFSNRFHSHNFIFCQICCNLTGKCQTIDCKDKNTTNKEIPLPEKPISDFQTYQFWCFGILATVSMAAANSLFTITDTACCESVQKSGAQFGRQRLWGAIGWGLITPIGGLLNDYTGDFLASFVLMAIISFMSLLNMTRLEMTKPKFSNNLLKNVGIVMSSKEFLAFKLCVVMNGVGTGIMWFYLVLFLTDIGGSRFLCGMVMFVQCFVGEIPFMFFADWVIKKIGHFNVMTLALTAYSIRFFWYSQLHNPWLVLPAEIFHGFTYGLFYTNVAAFAKMSAKPGTEATTQAVLFTAHDGIGVGLGCILAGNGFDSIGGHKTFYYTSMYAGCAAVISIILHLMVRKQKRNFRLTTTTKA